MKTNVIVLVLLLTFTKHVVQASAYWWSESDAYNADNDDVDDGVDGTSAGCPHTHECIPYSRCSWGHVDSGGEVISTTHIRKECSHPDYPGVPSVCCRIPQEVSTATAEVAGTCPRDYVCVEGDSCQRDIDGAGLIRYSFQNRCIKDKANNVDGICCYSPTEVVNCPQDSICISEDQCQGEALKNTSVYLPYSKSGSWSECALSGDLQRRGICCRKSAVNVKSPPRVICGLRNSILRVPSLTPKAIEETGFGELPWHAILFFKNDTFKCTASLVSYGWLVTTAHCVNGYQPSDFKVRVGEWRINSLEETLPHIDASIASITIHPGFNSMSLKDNVAVIKLTEPVEHNLHINPVCLPTMDQVIHPETECIVSGWGRDAFQEGRQEILKMVKLPFVGQFDCERLLRRTRLGANFFLERYFMCAGGEEKRDSCPWAGGGPLACRGEESAKYVLQGIAAWSISCGQKDIPSVFTDVRIFVDWIRDVIGDSDNV